MSHRSYLTHDEMRIARDAEFDLAVGYPHVTGPKWLTDLWYDRSVHDLTALFLEQHPGISLARGQRLPAQGDLLDAALVATCEFLGLPSSLAANGVITYSGSHALERVITACLAGRADHHAVTTDPSIDIISAMVSECNVAIKHVPAPSLDRCPDISALIEAAAPNGALVVVSSPENPTGATYDKEDLASLAEALDDLDVPLLVDQSFLKVAPFGATAALPLSVSATGRWAFMWDTGKTLAMADAKLGIILAGSDLYPVIAKRVEVLQYTIPAPTLMLFTLALRMAADTGYCKQLSATVAGNVVALEKVFAGSPVTVLRPTAGGFALLRVDTPLNGMSGTDLAESVLLEARVGVVGGERFFHVQPAGATLLRVATTRDPAMLIEGAERIRKVVERLARLPRGAMFAAANVGGPHATIVRSESPRSGARRPIAVIGTGVTGLSCAYDLSVTRSVEVLHDRGLLDSTSAVATAIWHVYLVDPNDTQHLDWSSRTLLRLLDLTGVPAAGVELCKGVELFRDTPEHRPPWADLLRTFRPLSAGDLLRFPGRTWGYEIEAPTANMAKYLPWLREACEDRGVVFRRQSVASLAEIAPHYADVINCAGLRAGDLCDDPELFPVRGQYVVLRPGDAVLDGYVGDDENPGGMAYAISRDGEILVGGTEEANVYGLEFVADADAMIKRANEFVSIDLCAMARTRTVVGLRPCRVSKRVRFGWDPVLCNVFHNYGHGGSGFSLAWGCSEDVTQAVFDAGH